MVRNLYILEVEFLCGEERNKNGRFYPIGLLEREVARYTQECIREDKALGECGHPNTPTLNLDRVCMKILELKRDGNHYNGKAKILEHLPMGQIVKGLIDENVKLGVSSRGVGSLKEDTKNGWQRVQDDFKLCVAADVVADPSGIGCIVQGIRENVSWIYDSASGTWLEEKLDNIKKELHTLSKHK